MVRRKLGVTRCAQYLLEHGVVEFAGSIQGDNSVEEDINGGQNHSDNHQYAIDKLVKTQPFVLCDVAVWILESGKERRVTVKWCTYSEVTIKPGLVISWELLLNHRYPGQASG